MSEIKRLLEVKMKLKRNTPNFLRQDAHKRRKLAQNWRKPKGMHSKMRRRLKGYRRSVEVGFKSPSLVRFLDKEGLLPVRVSALNELLALNPQKHSIIISASVGNKKRIAIIDEAKKKGLKILNINVEKFLEKTKVEQEAKKKEEKKKEAEKEKVAKEPEKKELTEEEKKEQEKKEKEKILTKRV